MNTAKRIAELRMLHGMSQEDLAERLIISRSVVAKWENGTRMPDRRTVEKLSELFGVPPDSICETDKSALREIEACVPDGDAGSLDVQQAIDAFLSGLTEKERNVFLRRYHFFEKPSEIAERYGMTPVNVRVMLHRLRAGLRKALSDSGSRERKEKKQ